MHTPLFIYTLLYLLIYNYIFFHSFSLLKIKNEE